MHFTYNWIDLKMDLVFQETCRSSQVLKTWRLVQETNEKKLFIKSRQIARQLPAIETWCEA